jgi:hypothetical protein
MTWTNSYTRRAFMDSHDNTQARDTLLFAGGVALMIFGAGMLLASPVIRRTVLGVLTPMLPGQDRANGALGGLLPDVERYMRLKTM